MRTHVQGQHDGLYELEVPGQSKPEGLLDLAQSEIVSGQVSQGMQTLFSTLKHTRDTLVPEDWRRFCTETCHNHPIRNLLLQEPFTRRGFQKPRKYAGDAVVLDFIYEDRAPERLSALPVGVEINRFLCAQPTIAAVRERRNRLAQWLDKVSGQVPGARALAVACGHLRESHQSQAVRERRLGELLALDQDMQSLGVIDSELGHLDIKPVHGSVKALLKNEMRFEQMDLIYAAGLYDYLSQPIAIRLTGLLFSMLRSGGHLVLANYADPIESSAFKAYMEAFMDWWLIYREESDVAEWMHGVPKAQVLRHNLFRDETRNIIYLELTRR